MHALVWDDVAAYFELDGSLRDAYVFDVSMADWQHVIDVVRTQRWRLDYTVDGSSQPLPQRSSDIFAARGDTSTTLTIWPTPDIAVNTHFFSADEIEFDFDPGELQGQDRLDVLCAFLRTIGGTLNKLVVLTPENNPGWPLLTYTPDDDRVIATRSGAE
jgi:hypothetical protein